MLLLFFVLMIFNDFVTHRFYFLSINRTFPATPFYSNKAKQNKKKKIRKIFEFYMHIFSVCTYYSSILPVVIWSLSHYHHHLIDFQYFVFLYQKLWNCLISYWFVLSIGYCIEIIIDKQNANNRKGWVGPSDLFI